MNIFGYFIFVLEILGSVAFAISGAGKGIKKGLDVFGVVILGGVTAVGGGVIRDIILGINPPGIFIHPMDLIIAMVTSAVVFIIAYRSIKIDKPVYGRLLFFMDSLGVAMFTVLGVQIAYSVSEYPAFSLLLFVGAATGVGGGVLRDVLVNEVPMIFVKRIYAISSIAGAFLCVVLWNVTYHVNAMIFGGVCIVVIRLLADKFDWQLPRIEPRNDE